MLKILEMKTDSVKCYFVYLAIFITVQIMISCDEKNETNTLGETELYFDEKTTSISSCGHDAVWVGSETGRIWKVKGNSSEEFDVGDERIYKVLSSSDSDTLWIGMRNSGLQKWIVKDNIPKRISTYSIDVKGDKYSPYDILRMDDYLFVATTQGLYKLHLSDKNDSLELLYPQAGDLSDKYKHSFVINSLCHRKHKLYAATEHGIITVDTKNNTCTEMLKELSINHLSLYQDTLYALSGNSLYLLSLSGDLLRKTDLKFSPKVYYQSEGVHYLADRDNMLISKNLQDFIFITLRKKISDKCRNIFLTDPHNDFILVLMEDALWRIPKHTGVFESNDFIKNACAANNHTYYLTADNDLYLQRGNEKKAVPVFTFPKEEQIIWMATDGEHLYYYNSEQEVKMLSVSHYLLKNLIFLSPKTIYASEHKITAAHLKKDALNSILYLGVQDGLLELDPGTGIANMIPDFERRYVTSFYMPEHSRTLYLSTLNSGVFYKTEKTDFKYIEGTGEYSSIKDILITNEYHPKLITLTNHDIYTHMPADSLVVRGCNKLLYVSDSLFYTVLGSGIRGIEIDKAGMIREKANYYTDICFNPAASFVNNGRVYLGSNMGVLTFLPGDETNSYWVSFLPNIIFSLKYIFLIITLVLTFACYAIFRHYRRKRRNKNRLLKQLIHLQDCVEELYGYYNLSSEEEKQQINKLKASIDEINIDACDRKYLNQLMDELTDEIIQLNREVSLRLLKKLEVQIGQLTEYNAFESVLLKEESERILKSNEIDQIKCQIELNETWMSLFDQLEVDLRVMSELLDGCAEIDGVTTLIMKGIEKINEDMSRKPLDDIRQSFAVIKSSFERIYEEKALITILEYAENHRQFLNSRKQQDEVSEFLNNELIEIRSYTSPDERLYLLRVLHKICVRVDFLRYKDEIDQCIQSYIKKRDEVIVQNDQLINKKFDKELDLLIAGETKDYVDRLENLIVSMYKLLNTTDHVIINDLLKISSYYHQQAKVLALLIVSPRLKRSLIPGMLGIYGNLNPVISRLINNKIKSNEDFFKLYMEKDPMNIVFVYYVLKLID
ncbi:MAG: hypothetical protein ACRCX4_15105 [Bacteroidales bacterium]